MYRVRSPVDLDTGKICTAATGRRELRQLRAKRETSRPMTIPARPMPTSVTQGLEAGAIDGGCAGQALIAVDDDDLIVRPAERDGALLEGILTLRAFGVLQDLLAAPARSPAGTVHLLS